MSLLDSIGSKLKEIGADFANLDVLTLTGDIKVEKAKSEAGDTPEENCHCPKLIRRWPGAAVKTGGGGMTVVALTHIDLDADSVNFVKKDPTPDEMILIEAHKAAVTSAQETRKGIVDMARSQSHS